MDKPVVHIGCGAGFSGDRVDAAIPVVETLSRRKGPRYLIFETLAERTLALAQKHRQRDPEHGYSPFLESYVRPILKKCLAADIKIVSNFLGSIRINFTSSGFALYKIDTIIVLIQTDLPAPVAPATRRWGI